MVKPKEIRGLGKSDRICSIEADQKELGAIRERKC